jgi:hypothetical protein
MIWYTGRGRQLWGGSAEFLISYAKSLGMIQGEKEVQLSTKGMEVMEQECIHETEEEGSGTNLNWRPPSVGWIKLNTYAGYRQSSGEASSGVVVRDESGNVLLSAWKPLRYVSSAEEAEAEACLHGMKLVAERFRHPVCIESDCAVLVKAISKKEDDRSRWTGVIKEIQSMKTLFPGCVFDHSRRQSN